MQTFQLLGKISVVFFFIVLSETYQLNDINVAYKFFVNRIGVTCKYKMTAKLHKFQKCRRKEQQKVENKTDLEPAPIAGSWGKCK